MGDERAKKLGLSRRTFMASSMGLATCFLASNKVYGKVWEVDEAETWEPAAYDEKWPKSEYFVIDCQSHFTNGLALGGANGFRTMEFVKNMGLIQERCRVLRSRTSSQMFFDSETLGRIQACPTRRTSRRTARCSARAHTRCRRQGPAVG
jgi:hypothetical protein